MCMKYKFARIKMRREITNNERKINPLWSIGDEERQNNIRDKNWRNTKYSTLCWLIIIIILLFCFAQEFKCPLDDFELLLWSKGGQRSKVNHLDYESSFDCHYFCFLILMNILLPFSLKSPYSLIRWKN